MGGLTDARSSSVGSIAMERFLRPVCYQGFPDALLPEPLRQAAAITGPHRIDGEYRAGGGHRSPRADTLAGEEAPKE